MKHTGRNQASTYKGNGKFAYQTWGSIIPRPLTDEEKHVEQALIATWGEIIGEFKMLAGTNMQKPIWIIKIYDGREVESYEGPHELDKELTRWLVNTYPEIASEYNIGS